jgi:hypothetical protein
VRLLIEEVMAKKKFDLWDAEEWLYTEFLQAGGPLGKEWIRGEFTKRKHLHRGNPEVVLEVCLQKLGIEEKGLFFCPPI